MDETERRFLKDLGKAKALLSSKKISTKKNSENRLLRARQVES